MNSCEAEIAQPLSGIIRGWTGTHEQWPDFISLCCLTRPHSNYTSLEVTYGETEGYEEDQSLKVHPVALTLQTLQTACLGHDSGQEIEEAHTKRCSSELNVG